MQRKAGGLCAYLQDAVFNAGGEELGGGEFGDGEALGLDEGAGVLGDAVEGVLEGGSGDGSAGRVADSIHESIIAGVGA